MPKFVIVRRTILVSVVLCAAMVIIRIVADNTKPNIYLAEQRSFPQNMELIIPESFGDWEKESGRNTVVVNPQQQELINRIYAKVINRTYKNSLGDRVMLSIAYGRDQRSDMAVHYPEVCYPAQGFSVTGLTRDLIEVPDKVLNVKRMSASQGSARKEPVTYWVTIGDHAGVDGFQRRIVELEYGVRRIIPDGLLFRVSSIGDDPAREYQVHDSFVKSMLSSVSTEVRSFLSGKPKKQSE